MQDNVFAACRLNEMINKTKKLIILYLILKLIWFIILDRKNEVGGPTPGTTNLMKQ